MVQNLNFNSVLLLEEFTDTSFDTYSLLRVLQIQFTAQVQHLPVSLNDTGRILYIHVCHKIRICHYIKYQWAAWTPYTEPTGSTQHTMGTNGEVQTAKHSKKKNV